MKPKICFFNSAVAWGGGEKWHLEMADALFKRGYDVLVVAHQKGILYQKAIEKKLPVKGMNISNISFINPFRRKQIKKLLEGEGINKIILNLPSDLKVAAFAAQKAGVDDVIYRRGSAIPVKNNFLNRWLFRNIVSKIIANSEETKRTIRINNSRIFDPEKIFVVYNGIDLAYWQNIERKEEGEQLILGNLGRMVYQKQQEQLIDLLALLKKKNVSVKLKIGGAGGREQFLRRYATAKKVNDMIDFCGFVHDNKAFMESIDLFVLTSKWEGFGYVMVEAMACQVPVLAYKISSNPEIISHQQSGFLVDYGDIKQLAYYVEWATHNRQLIKEMGLRGKERVKNHFTLEKSINAFEEVLMLKS